MKDVPLQKEHREAQKTERKPYLGREILLPATEPHHGFNRKDGTSTYMVDFSIDMTSVCLQQFYMNISKRDDIRCITVEGRF